MNFNEIIYSVENNIATITLNRPEKLNAFTKTMQEELQQALNLADNDNEVRAIVFTGAGRAFCAGADLSAGAKTFDYDQRPDRAVGETSPVKDDGSIDYSHEAVRDNGGMLTLRIFDCTKPVIGAINGAAVGVGVTMQLPMDIRIASKNAKFGFVFSRRGIVPEACSSWFLPRIVGIEQALKWCYSGAVFDAEEALKGGLVSEVVEPENLLARAYEIANEIAQNTAAVSISLTRNMMWRMLGESHPMAAHKIDSRAVYSRGRTEDAKEGIVSFLEKRPAIYPNQVPKDLPDFFPWWINPKWS